MNATKTTHQHIYVGLSDELKLNNETAPLLSDIAAAKRWLARMTRDDYATLLACLNSEPTKEESDAVLSRLGAPAQTADSDWRGYLYVMELSGRSTHPCAGCR